MLLQSSLTAIDLVSHSSRLPLSKEDCDVLNALQRDPEGENEVLYPNQCSLVKGGESESSTFRTIIFSTDHICQPRHPPSVSKAASNPSEPSFPSSLLSRTPSMKIVCSGPSPSWIAS
jgi:hypothetical protein